MDFLLDRAVVHESHCLLRVATLADKSRKLKNGGSYFDELQLQDRNDQKQPTERLIEQLLSINCRDFCRLENRVIKEVIRQEKEEEETHSKCKSRV